jgi:hypothetical protein
MVHIEVKQQLSNVEKYVQMKQEKKVNSLHEITKINLPQSDVDQRKSGN